VRRTAAALLAVGVVATAAACGGGSSRSIVVYNGQHLELTRAFASAFERSSGISVRLRTNDAVVLADQLLQEGGSSPADVFLSENSPELVNLEEHDRLAALSASLLRQVPHSDSSSNGKWIGVALRVGSLVYNPKLLKRSQLPASVLDLAAPEWKGKVAVAPLDSDFPPVVGAVIATKGSDAASGWLAGLKRNAAVYASAEAVVAAVNRGDVAAGLINQYYWYRLRREVGAGGMHSTLYYFPRGDVGSVVNIAGAAVVSSSKHRADAERFVAFLVSREGQTLIARGDDFEYPARPGVAPNAALPPLARIAHARLRAGALGDDREAAELIVRAGFGS
jgi:iron(III) transport system substrate-binding protein